MLNKKVLVKSVTSLSEARYCAGMFVDYISFDLNEESEYYVPKKKLEEIRGWLSGVKILGSLGTADVSLITASLEEYGLDGFLFSPEQFHLLPLVDTPLKVLEWSDDVALLPFIPDPEVILLLTSAEAARENQLADLDNEILQGFDFENVKSETERINGFAFMGSFEKQVGISAHSELMEALEYIEENY
ncbi:MAG: hypothetical protein KF870_00520 [Leadbetterella sp.]|nr:hypothetical protein [Leadbetterella sp.]